MDLIKLAATVEIVTNIAIFIALTTSAIVAILLYKWHQRSARITNNRLLNEDMRHFNELIISNDKLQDLEIERHTWGNLEKDQIITMYQYFILLNTTQSAWKAFDRKALDKELYDSHANNTAKLTHKDRDFITKHVFPRGYNKNFQKEIEKRWETIKE